jgi:hypothetical protein
LRTDWLPPICAFVLSFRLFGAIEISFQFLSKFFAFFEVIFGLKSIAYIFGRKYGILARSKNTIFGVKNEKA